jgi:hypothetical protein
MTPLRLLSTILGLSLAGCGELPQAADKSVEFMAPARAEYQAKAALRPEAPAPTRGMGAMMGALAPGSALGPTASQPAPNAIPAASATISRKIIYDAQVDLIVDSVEPIAKKVPTLVQQAQGYLSEQNVSGSPGSQRSMHWKFRIPVDRFDSFVDSILALGELERNNRTSQDITEQYYDLEARIKNKKVEEQTLNKILQERSGKLEDVLKIEIELSRVRGEIEQLEGKIRVLENLSSLATLTLNVRERDKYAPPPPVVADFPTQITRVWDTSLLGLVNTGKSIVLWAVSWAIWVPFFFVGLIIALILLRWLIGVFKRNLPRLVALARTPITPPRAQTPSQ